MKRVRLIDTGQAPARHNVAITASLAEMHCSGAIPDTLRFHVYPRCVLIGRHQNPRRAVQLDYCVREGLEIARRITGGGAVYMNAGVLAWDMVTDRSRFGRNADVAMEIIGEGFAVGLSRLGLPVRFRPRNEIEVSGRKIGGGSGMFMGATLLAQGTVLIDFAMNEMADALVLPVRSADAGDLAARVASLSSFLGYAPRVDDLKAMIVAGLARHLRVEFENGEFSPPERDFAARLHDEEFGTEEFVLGNTAQAQPTILSASRTVPAGRLEAHIRLLPGRERRIEQIWITGDFAASTSRLIPDLEAALRNRPVHDASRVALVMLESSSARLFGVSQTDIADVIAAVARSKPAQQALGQ